MSFLANHGALLILAVFAVNVAIFYARANRLAKQHPDRADGYRWLLRGMAIWGGAPMALAAVMEFTGGLRWFAVIPPREASHVLTTGDLAVLAVWLIAVVRFAWWVWLSDGALAVANYGDFFNGGAPRPWTVRLWSIILLAGFAFGISRILAGN